jgi:hypothetical protein
MRKIVVRINKSKQEQGLSSKFIENKQWRQLGKQALMLAHTHRHMHTHLWLRIL